MIAWLIMWSSVAFVPILLIIVGLLFLKKPPKRISYWYGYRTRMSRLNQETWAHAHEISGRLFWRIGWVMLAISLIVMLPFTNASAEVLANLVLVLTVVFTLGIVLIVYLTEMSLRRHFDHEGRRIY